MRPKYFIVCDMETIERIFREGWVDIIRGAKENHLTIIDRDDRDNRMFYNILRMKMEKERTEK